MKLPFVCAAVAALVVSSGVHADIYNDSTDDIFDLAFTHLDIKSVEVTNDDANLYVTFQLNGKIDDPNWGKYCMLFDTTSGGVSSPSNPWGRNILTDTGNEFWLGSWVDGGGGAQLWKNDGTVWDGAEFAATYSAGTGLSQDLSGAASGMVSYAIALSNLGVGAGDTIFFDAIATAGGSTDPGVDHLSRPDIATPGWADPSSTGKYLEYKLIPAPGSLALLGLGGLLAAVRRR